MDFTIGLQAEFRPLFMKNFQRKVVLTFEVMLEIFRLEFYNSEFSSFFEVKM